MKQFLKLHNLGKSVFPATPHNGSLYPQLLQVRAAGHDAPCSIVAIGDNIQRSLQHQSNPQIFITKEAKQSSKAKKQSPKRTVPFAMSCANKNKWQNSSCPPKTLETQPRGEVLGAPQGTFSMLQQNPIFRILWRKSQK